MDRPRNGMCVDVVWGLFPPIHKHHAGAVWLSYRTWFL